MNREQIDALARRIYDAFNANDTAEIDQTFAEDYVEHVPPMPGQPRGREGLKWFLNGFHTAFPDLRMTIEDTIAEGEKGVVRYSMTGTHTGEFMGMPPSGKQFKVSGIDIARIVNGKCVEHWGEVDMLGLMQQIGAIPMPG